MLNPKILDDIAGKVSSLLAATPASEIDKNLRALLGNAFSKLDLVTREEFDVQRAVLARSREKLTQLEARINELEGKTASAPPAAK